MKRTMQIFAVAAAVFLAPSVAGADDGDITKLVNKLQNVSVTVKSQARWGSSEGSGIIFTRDIKDREGKTHKINFVWTAGHVIDNLRTVRKVTDPHTGTDRKVIEFNRPQVLQELRDEKTGQRIGEIRMDTVVLCYSDADTGEDLALLMVLKKNFIKDTVDFYLDEKIPGVGTYICHVGSRHGQFGSNSFTSGRVSQIGRVFRNVGQRQFDQVSAAISPGSSGGGVFIEKGKNASKCIGLVVRGGESTFGFIVPVRRMAGWAKKMGVSWAMNPEMKAPLLEEMGDITIEDGWVNRKATKAESSREGEDVAPKPGDDGPRIHNRKVLERRDDPTPEKAVRRSKRIPHMYKMIRDERTERPVIRKMVRRREAEVAPVHPIHQIMEWKAMAD